MRGAGGAAGYVPVALSATDYIELLPARWQAINAHGVKLNHRSYDSVDLNPFRRQPSGVRAKKNSWEVHHDPYDVNRIWVRNHWDGGWIMCYWKHLHRVRCPSGSSRGITPAKSSPTRASSQPRRRSPTRSLRCSPRPAAAQCRRATRSANLRRRHQASAGGWWHAPRLRRAPRQRTRADPPVPALPSDDPGAEPDDAGSAEVVPLPIFNARVEAARWW